MKKTILCFLLAAVCLLSACAKLPTFDYENGTFVNSKTGITYLPASANYEAAAYVTGSEIAHIAQSGMDDILVYPVKGAEDESLLTTPLHDLFYAEGTVLPTLAEMKPERLDLCRAANQIYSLAAIKEKETIDALIEIYGGEGFSDKEISVTLTKEVYELRFQSTAHAGFYYCLSYWEFSDDVLVYQEIEDPEAFEVKYPGVEVTTEEYKGEWYAVYHCGSSILYDRVTRLCYPIGSLLTDYLPAEEETA